jgi:hypothetical protein
VVTDAVVGDAIAATTVTALQIALRREIIFYRTNTQNTL